MFLSAAVREGELLHQMFQGQMIYKQAFLGFIGLSAGGIVAAGIFAFLAIIGVFPRLIGTTRTKRHIMLCETMMLLGGTVGNLMDLFHLPSIPGGVITLGIWGLSSGIFVGSLVMSLAETSKALPVLSRRIHLTVGLPCVIAAVAAGKCLGALVYFICFEC